MPPMGGAQLSQADVAAVAAYVWAIGHAGGALIWAPTEASEASCVGAEAMGRSMDQK